MTEKRPSRTGGEPLPPLPLCPLSSPNRPTAARSRGTLQPLHRAELGWRKWGVRYSTSCGAQSGHFAAPPPRRVGPTRRRAVGALCSPSTAPSWVGESGVFATRPPAARSRGTLQPLHRAELGWVGLSKNYAPTRIERRRGMPGLLLGLSSVVRMLVLWRRALALGAPLWFPAACRAPPSRAPGRAAPSCAVPRVASSSVRAGGGGRPEPPSPLPRSPSSFPPPALRFSSRRQFSLQSSLLFIINRSRVE
jgi:hypothetical protein